MSDMYGKLGDLLNNVLEAGQIPQEEITKDQDPVNYKGDGENSDPFFIDKSAKEKSTIHRKKIINNDSIPQGFVYKAKNTADIKMHKYTKIMHIPLEVSKSLDTLHIVSLEDLNESKLKQIYHQLLKENHPDTANKNCKNSDKKGENNRIDEIKQAYNTVYFFIKNL